MSASIRQLERRVDRLAARAFERSGHVTSARTVAQRELSRARDPAHVRRLENIARYGIDPTTLPRGTLREVKEVDRTGRQISHSVGDPEAVWGQFKLPTRRARFTEDTVRGLANFQRTGVV